MQSSERASKLYGAMVIALAEGLRLGRVAEVYIDQQAKQIMGISYRSGLWGADKEIYIQFEDIRKFGSDMVIVSGKEAGMELPEQVDQWSLRALKGYDITSAAGKHIAVLADFVINREDGKIVEILVPENRILQIDIGEVLIGPDCIVVPADFEPVFIHKIPDQNDFITRIFGSATLSEKLRDSLEGVKTSMRSAKSREKVWQTLRTSSLMARDTVSRTAQAIQQAIDQMIKKREAEKGNSKEEERSAEKGHPKEEERSDDSHG
jgi:sporulation protein YlmC with PRC-barrel domain